MREFPFFNSKLKFEVQMVQRSFEIDNNVNSVLIYSLECEKLP
jgi:hypothetical protein